MVTRRALLATWTGSLLVAPAGAEPHYRKALSLAGELGMRPLLARCHLGLGQLLARTGQLGMPREPLLG